MMKQFSNSKLKSLGYQSDILILSFASQLVQHEKCIQIITAKNPDFYWGNFLIFPHKPRSSDFKAWTQEYRKRFPGAKHIAIGWDEISDDCGQVEHFLQDGFELTKLSVLTANNDALTQPKKILDGLNIRPLHSDDDWQKAINLQIECNEDYPPKEFNDFKQQQMRQHRENSNSGHGHWYGAFLEDELIADLGIYSGNDVSRFQSVETKKKFRRRGIASHLVYQASQHALKLHPENTLVIVAETNEPAVLMYEGVGYRVAERQFGLLKRPSKYTTSET